MLHDFFQYTLKKSLVLLILGTTLSACYDKPTIFATEDTVVPLSVPKTLSISKNASVMESEQKNYMIWFSPPIDEIPLNQYFDMEVKVRGSMWQPLKFPLELSVEAGMRNHNHGMNVNPEIIDLGQGNYKIKGLLMHMSGEWFLEFRLRRGAISDKAEINLEVFR